MNYLALKNNLQIVMRNGLVDLGYVGLQYKCFSNQTHIVIVFERLDRTVTNQQ